MWRRCANALGKVATCPGLHGWVQTSAMRPVLVVGGAVGCALRCGAAMVGHEASMGLAASLVAVPGGGRAGLWRPFCVPHHTQMATPFRPTQASGPISEAGLSPTECLAPAPYSKRRRFWGGAVVVAEVAAMPGDNHARPHPSGARPPRMRGSWVAE